MAEGPGHLALSGAHLQLPGYHGPDARGGKALHYSGQELEGHHEAGPARQESAQCHRHREDVGETQEIQRAVGAYPEGWDLSILGNLYGGHFLKSSS